MISQTPPQDTPFGLAPNVAAGLAYLLGIVGGIVMLVGGGTNPHTRRAAAQSIVMWGGAIVLFIALDILTSAMGFSVLLALSALLNLALSLACFVAWIWTSVASFQGKDVRIPIVSGIASSVFKTAN